MPILSTVLPTLLDAWLLGLTDSEGSFSVSFLSNSNHAFRIRFLICQKWDANKPILLHIATLFGVGYVEPHSVPGHWELRIGGLRNCIAIFNYFSMFTLKTVKHDSYLRFLELHARISAKEHLDPVKRQELKGLAAKINPSRRSD